MADYERNNDTRFADRDDDDEESSPGPRSGGRGERPAGRGRRPAGRGGFTRRPRLCPFCPEKVKSIDYKQVEMLKRMVKDEGKIRPRRETGLCSKHQRMVATAVKRARHMALLPFASDR